MLSPVSGPAQKLYDVIVWRVIGGPPGRSRGRDGYTDGRPVTAISKHPPLAELPGLAEAWPWTNWEATDFHTPGRLDIVGDGGSGADGQRLVRP